MSSKKKPIRQNRYKQAKKKTSSVSRFQILRKLGICLKTMCCVGILAVMSLSLIFIHDFLTQCDYFRAEYITILGTSRISDQDVLEYSGIQKNENILAVNLPLARKQLMAHPWVAEVEISRELPKGVTIRVREHKALAVLDMRRRFLINYEGEIFKESDSSDPGNLPVVSGLDYSDLGPSVEQKSRPLAAVVEWLVMRSRMKKAPPELEFNKIKIDREIGLTLLFADEARSVCLGYSDYNQKANRLRRVVHYLKRSSQLESIQSIDLINPDRVILRPLG